MTPEWMASLLEDNVVPDTSNDPEVQFARDGFDENGLLSDSTVRAIRALDAFDGLGESDLTGVRIGSEQSTAAPVYGGGGMSPDTFFLVDAYHTIKRLLEANPGAQREVYEFTNAVERLMKL